MKIAFASQEFPPAGGGISTQTSAKARGLAGLGHSVYVVSRSLNGSRSVNNLDGIEVIRIPGAVPDLPVLSEAARWISYSAALAAELMDLHERVHLDVIDLPDYGGEGYVHLANRGSWPQIPTVIQLHGPSVMLAETIGWPERGSALYEVGTSMERACLRLADGIYSSSDCSAEWCRRFYCDPETHIPVIHLGVDTDAFSPSRNRQKRADIIVVGRVAASKGIVNLLEAALSLRAEFPDLRLVVVGHGEPAFVQSLLDRVAAAGATSLLRLVGPVPNAALPALLREAAVFALPSYYEGGPGMAYLEAMACQLPVVATSAGGAVEVVADGVTGIVVDPTSVPQLTDALTFLLRNPDSASEMGRRGREFVLTNADRRQCLGRLEAYLQGVVNGCRF